MDLSRRRREARLRPWAQYRGRAREAQFRDILRLVVDYAHAPIKIQFSATFFLIAPERLEMQDAGTLLKVATPLNLIPAVRARWLPDKRRVVSEKAQLPIRKTNWPPCVLRRRNVHNPFSRKVVMGCTSVSEEPVP